VCASKSTMLRFFSRRGRPRGDQKAAAEARYAHLRSDQLRQRQQQRGAAKHVIACKVILLDGSDLSIDIPVRNGSKRR